MTTPRKLLIGAIFILLLALAVVVAMTQSQSARRANLVTLADGTRLEFLGVAPGGVKFTTGRPWHPFARKLLPARFKKWIPTPITCSYSPNTNNLVIYFRLDPTPALGRPSWDRFMAEDSAGFRYPTIGGYAADRLDATTSVGALTLETFPRREKDFLLHLQTRTNENVTIATFRVPNPFYKRFPLWQPSPLPQTLTNGPVALTLSSLAWVADSPDASIKPTWRMASANPAWTNARVDRVTYLDATGNEDVFLSPREKAWKVRAKVVRDRTEDFAPDEQLVITNLAAPASNTFVSIDQTKNCTGVELKVLVISGPGKLTMTNRSSRSIAPLATSSRGRATLSGHFTAEGGVEHWSSTHSFLVFEAKGTRPDDQIIIRFRDDQGREPKPLWLNYSSTDAGSRSYFIEFDPAIDAKSLTLFLILNRPLQFEYLINPADIQTSAH